MLARTIIVTAVGESRGTRFFCLRTTCDRLGCLYEEVGMRCDVVRELRCVRAVIWKNGLKQADFMVLTFSAI